mgnify:CR=1 FL=1
MKKEMIEYKKKKDNRFLYIVATFAIFIALFINNASKVEWVTVDAEIKQNSSKWHQIQEIRDNIQKKDKILFSSQELLKKRNNELRWKPKKKWLTIFMTTYNAKINQTDSTPCIAWWTWINICDAEKEWRRIIALSQELTAWSQLWKVRKAMNCWRWCTIFEPWEMVKLTQTQADIDKHWVNSRCEGLFEVWDAMNIRFRKRWDIFFSDKAMNTSCEVVINKI